MDFKLHSYLKERILVVGSLYGFKKLTLANSLGVENTPTCIDTTSKQVAISDQFLPGGKLFRDFCMEIESCKFGCCHFKLICSHYVTIEVDVSIIIP